MESNCQLFIKNINYLLTHISIQPLGCESLRNIYFLTASHRTIKDIYNSIFLMVRTIFNHAKVDTVSFMFTAEHSLSDSEYMTGWLAYIESKTDATNDIEHTENKRFKLHIITLTSSHLWHLFVFG